MIPPINAPIDYAAGTGLDYLVFSVWIGALAMFIFLIKLLIEFSDGSRSWGRRGEFMGIKPPKQCIYFFTPKEIHQYHKNKKGADGWDGYLTKILGEIKSKDEEQGIAKHFKR